MNFEEKVIRYIIDNFEGGYSNRNPIDDPGGETKYGISKRQYPHPDIRILTKSEAVNIYKKDCATSVRFEKFASDNPRLAACVLDFCIHPGPINAVKTLQRSGRIPQDGKIGPVTLGLAAKPEIIERYLTTALAHFMSGFSNFQANKNGWYKRLFQLSAMPV